jgi:hypothetical protein
LKKAGQYKEAQELQARVLKSSSYEEALSIMLEYVEDLGEDSEEEEDDDCE